MGSCCWSCQCSLAMRILIVITLCLSLVQGKKNKLNHDEKEMKKCRGALDDIQKKIDKLLEDVARVKKCLNTSDPDHQTFCIPPEESFSSTRNQVPEERRLRHPRTDQRQQQQPTLLQLETCISMRGKSVDLRPLLDGAAPWIFIMTQALQQTVLT